jgi:hypothetical protein
LTQSNIITLNKTNRIQQTIKKNKLSIKPNRIQQTIQKKLNFYNQVYNQTYNQIWTIKILKIN